MRFMVLLTLAFLIGKPQLVDPHSNVIIEGLDMILVLDASGSMQFQDFDNSNRSRFDVAKAEAIHFIEKRDNDAIGLVIFGNDAVSRCPLTLDKAMLKNAVQELELGFIDPDGTLLSRAIITAANRLKYSKAKSKIMILLTDGEPSEGDMDPKVAIKIAKELGIKIYTVGIGSDKQEYFRHPFFGLMPKPTINKQLLETIAKETGGQFFLAQNAKDMRTIYNTIDSLEKTEYETPIYRNYQDIFMPFLVAIIGLMGLEVFLSSLVWFSV